MEIHPAGDVNKVRLNPDEVAWLDRPRLDFELNADTGDKIKMFILQMAGRELVAEAFGLDLTHLDQGQAPTLEVTMTNEELDMLHVAARNGNMYAQFRIANQGLGAGRVNEYLARAGVPPVDHEVHNPYEYGSADKKDAQVTFGIMMTISAYRGQRAIEE